MDTAEHHRFADWSEELMSKRQVANAAGMVEYKPAPYRQVANVAGLVEYKPGPYRQVANIAGMVEYTPQESIILEGLENTLAAIRAALQANPNADISSLVAAYKAAIEGAFGVTFTAPTGDAWVFISLHFARQGLEATAKAFKLWAQGAGAIVNRYDLFKRVFGIFEIQNIGEPNDAAAAEVRLSNIVVFQQSDGDQWYMTPNNLIHELGHLFDAKAGFGYKKVGSLQYTITDTTKGGGTALHGGFNREGMAEGRDYLRERFLEHARILQVGTTNNAEFDPSLGEPPVETDPEYSQFVPSRYLFYDIAYNRFDVWRSPVYSTRYGTNARIDTLVHNNDATAVETVADAFLNWVRDWERPTFVDKQYEDEPDENQATAWRNFFTSNMGMFLRNASIYRLGMLQYYQSKGLIPLAPIATGNILTDRPVRLAPVDNDENNQIGTATSLLIQPVEIFGWLNVATPTPTLPYWLLVRGNNDRIVWITAEAIQHTESVVKANPQVNAPLLAPDRGYTSTDLQVITGE
jgi:hypothetical protein